MSNAAMIRFKSKDGTEMVFDEASKNSRLRKSKRVVSAVRRFWDLMVIESESLGGTEGMVNREGYTQMHIRVSKALQANFEYDQAHDVAGGDWAGDIINFSGDVNSQAIL